MPRRASSRYARRGADDKKGKTEGSFMKRLIGLTAVIAAAALVVVATAVAAKDNKTQLYSKVLGSGSIALKCFPDTPGTPTNGWTFEGSFDTQDACEAAIAGGGGGDVGPWTATACDGSVLIVSDVSQEDADAQAAAFDCSAGPAETPQAPAGVFLCYSADQVTPGVWGADVAPGLLKQGYWQAYAVKGNVAGGTNVGDFHLVCNVAAGQALGLQFADEGGWSTNANDHSAVAGAIGWYSVISG